MKSLHRQGNMRTFQLDFQIEPESASHIPKEQKIGLNNLSFFKDYKLEKNYHVRDIRID